MGKLIIAIQFNLMVLIQSSHLTTTTPLNQWRLQEPEAGGSNYFTLRKFLLQNIFYILVSNCFSKWENFIENGLKLINSFKKIENILKKDYPKVKFIQKNVLPKLIVGLVSYKKVLINQANQNRIDY